MRNHNWGASAKYHCLQPTLNHWAIQKLVPIDIFLDIWMVFVRRIGTAENSGRSVCTEDRNCGKQKCLKIFRKNFEKFRKISKKSKNCFVTEKFYRHKIFINLKILLAKNAPAVFGWKCYHYVTTWKTEKWAFLKVKLTLENISQ